MPNVHIDLWEGRDADTKRVLIQNVSKSVAESLDIPIEHVRVVLNEIKKENWGMNGDQASR